MKNYKALKLLEAFAECTKHSQRMLSAYNKISSIFPLNTAKYLILTDDEIEHIDQLVYRFSKLQDSIGERLFKSLLMFMEEDIKNKPFLDVLNRLEQLEIIPSKDEWIRLRTVRNDLSHEYSNDDEENVVVLNMLFDEIQTINTIFLSLRNYFDLHIRKIIDDESEVSG